MRTYPGVMALAIAVITAQLVATPTSAASLKHFKQLPRQSSQSLTQPNFFGNHAPVVGPKLPWIGEFTGGNRDHFNSVFNGPDGDRSVRASSLRDALRQSVFGETGGLHPFIGELSNDHFEGHRLPMGAERFRFLFGDGETIFQDWIDSKNPGKQNNVVPIPAAVWLLFSALAVLGWRGKNSAASKVGAEDTEKPVVA